jgi:superfamily II DNA helicase RecQ
MNSLAELDTAEGRALARTILRPQLPYDPHDYQLLGICKAVDGKNVIALIPTGGGKTGFIGLYMKLLLSMRDDERISKARRDLIPLRPVVVVVVPTKGLGQEMVRRTALAARHSLIFSRQANTLQREYALETLAFDSDRLAQAALRGEDLWKRTEDVHVLLLSPELLSRPAFASLLRVKTFYSRLVRLVVDELHLLDEWGPDFRTAFLQLGHMWARFPPGTGITGLSATLLVGAPTERVLKFLGLEHRQHDVVQRSNLRPNLRYIFRELATGLSGKEFPDIRWLLSTREKTLIFCKTANLSFRVLVYLWNLMDGTEAEKRIRLRMYNSILSDDFNEQTRQLMHDDASAQFIVATDALIVGIDFRSVWRGLQMGEHSTLGRAVQAAGRIGRDEQLVPEAEYIIYHTKGALDQARLIVDAGDQQRTDSIRTKGSASMDYAMARMLLASCARRAQNELYGNPVSDEPCLCESCLSTPPRDLILSCNCSPGCSHWTPPTSGLSEVEDTVSPSAPDEAKPTKPPHMSAAEKRAVREHFAQLRDNLWDSCAAEKRLFRTRLSFMPEKLIAIIASKFKSIKALEDVTTLVPPSLIPDSIAPEQYRSHIFSAISQLHPILKTVRARDAIDKKARKQARDAATPDETMPAPIT